MAIKLCLFFKEWKIKKILTALAFTFAMTTANAADIVDTAIGAGNFKTLATALTAALGKHS